ncbi:hypothetical protein H733_1022 [Haemophilus influenzae CGSHiCZ412602]|nr:hypothetical protein H733_1022 [Haemophilus influenzae CGSHiCZ412602]
MINLFIFCSFCRILGVRIRRRLKKVRSDFVVFYWAMRFFALSQLI